MMGKPLMNDVSLSQTAGRAKTRQPGLMVEPTQIVLRSYMEARMGLQRFCGKNGNSSKEALNSQDVMIRRRRV